MCVQYLLRLALLEKQLTRISFVWNTVSPQEANGDESSNGEIEESNLESDPESGPEPKSNAGAKEHSC